MAQIISITSEALQATIRRLLPSQQGFGEDLQASNVIQPILDLTPTAEGSALPQNFSQALNYGAITSTNVGATTADVCTGSGFFRLFGVSNIRADASATLQNFLEFTDGSTAKVIFLHSIAPGTSEIGESLAFDFVVFLRAGGADKITATSPSSTAPVQCASWQIGDLNGNLVQPSGFNPQ